MKLSTLVIQRMAQSTTKRRHYSFLARAGMSWPRSTSNVTSSLHGSSFPDSSMISSNHRQSSCSYSNTTKHSKEMKDEYGTMDDSGESYVVEDYLLENGEVLAQAELRYQTYGALNADKTNVLLICHALTGNASLHSWWGGLLGDGRAFDTTKYFVVCCNILGSCYGSTSPASINPSTGRKYGIHFPDVSVKDTVRLQLKLLQEHLHIKSVKSVIGGSFGGMQSMEAAVLGGSTDAEFVTIESDTSVTPFVKSVIPIACGASHTAWQIAISEVQRQSIYADPMWQIGRHMQATMGLAVARQMGMITYRTAKGYENKFGRAITTEEGDNEVVYGSKACWKAKSYLEYQGQKFLTRFDPVTYVKMTEQMDSHDISRGRHGSIEDVLSRITIPALVMGIDSDVLYPLPEQAFLAEHMTGSTFKVIHSDDGHDGFLLEQDQVAAHITEFLKQNK